MEKALLTQITPLSSHDGPGMRTTVFFKGCSLHCSWCHNPETISSSPDLMWIDRECIGCRICENSCLSEAIGFISKQGFCVDRQKCTKCFRCVGQCPSGALTKSGIGYFSDELIHEILKGEDLIRSMHGGVTFSGGEPALQADFIQPVSKALQEQKIHLALDTCGQVDFPAYEKLLPFMDLILFDIKEYDPEKHRQFTGVGNKKILENLYRIAEWIRRNNSFTRLWVRTPLVPGMTATEENIAGIGLLLSEQLADLVERWELCAFNNLCVSKYNQLGKNWSLAETPLMEEQEMTRLLCVARKAAPRIQQIMASGLTKK